MVSLHESCEGKILLQECSHLCCILQKSYGELLQSEPEYRETNFFQSMNSYLSEFREGFRQGYTIHPSNPCNSVNEVHPFILAINHLEKRVIYAFRATLFKGCLSDIFTDLYAFSDHSNWEGAQHSGFFDRIKNLPLRNVVHWLEQNYEVILTGHSLGGAVAQCFAAKTIETIVSQGKTPQNSKIRCITFGAPQVASVSFWRHLTDWFDHFDSYVHEQDIFFRLAVYAKQALQALFSWAIRAAKVALVSADASQTVQFFVEGVLDGVEDLFLNNDLIIPTFGLFGRYHFTTYKNNRLEVFSIDDPTTICNENWLQSLTVRGVVSGLGTFSLRDVYNHGCYWHCIMRLTNDSPPTTRKSLPKIVNLAHLNYVASGSISLDRNYNPSPIICDYELADFIYSFSFPQNLTSLTTNLSSGSESCEYGNRQISVPIISNEETIDYLRNRSSFSAECDSTFGKIKLNVSVLNVSLKQHEIQQMDPVALIYYSYWELLLSMGTQHSIEYDVLCGILCNSFHKLFGAFETIERSDFDNILSRLKAEIQLRPNVSRVLEKKLGTAQYPTGEIGSVELRGKEIDYLAFIISQIKLYGEEERSRTNSSFPEFESLGNCFCRTLKDSFADSDGAFTEAFGKIYEKQLKLIISEIYLIDKAIHPPPSRASAVLQDMLGLVVSAPPWTRKRSSIRLLVELRQLNLGKNRKSWFASNSSAHFIELENKLKEFFISDPNYYERNHDKILDWIKTKIGHLMNLTENELTATYSQHSEPELTWIKAILRDVKVAYKMMFEGIFFDSEALPPTHLIPLSLNFDQLRMSFLEIHETRSDYEGVVERMKVLLPPMHFAASKYARIRHTQAFECIRYKQRQWASILEGLGLYLSTRSILSDGLTLSEFALKPFQTLLYSIGHYFPYEAVTEVATSEAAGTMALCAFTIVSSLKGSEQFTSQFLENTNPDIWLLFNEIYGDKRLSNFSGIEDNWSLIFVHPPLADIKNRSQQQTWATLIDIINLTCYIRNQLTVYCRNKVLVCGGTKLGKSTFFRSLVDDTLAPQGYFDDTKHTRFPFQLRIQTTNNPLPGLTIADMPGVDDASSLGEFYVGSCVPHAPVGIVITTMEAFCTTATMTLVETLVLSPTTKRIIVLINKVDDELKKYHDEILVGQQIQSAQLKDWDTQLEEETETGNAVIQPGVLAVRLDSAIRSKKESLIAELSTRQHAKPEIQQFLNDEKNLLFIPIIMKPRHLDNLKALIAFDPTLRGFVKNKTYVLEKAVEPFLS